MKPRTLYDKIWEDHLVDEQPDGTCLIYVDRHLVHEVTSPQAFEGLRAAGRKVHAPDKTLAVVDHNVPTTDRSKPNPDPESAEQIAALAKNAKDFGIEYFNEFDKRQGLSTLSGPSRVSRCPAPRSCAATAILRRTVPSARSPTASVHPKLNMCSRRKR